jgi:hypothetical protein
MEGRPKPPGRALLTGPRNSTCGNRAAAGRAARSVRFEDERKL